MMAGPLCPPVLHHLAELSKDCPKASCDNEAQLDLSKGGPKLSFRIASKGKNKLTQASKWIPEDESGTGQGVYVSL